MLSVLVSVCVSPMGGEDQIHYAVLSPVHFFFSLFYLFLLLILFNPVYILLKSVCTGGESQIHFTVPSPVCLFFFFIRFLNFFVHVLILS